MYHVGNELPFDDLREADSAEMDFFNNDLYDSMNIKSLGMNYKINKNSNRKSRKVTFYKNGDKYFVGKMVTVAPNRYFSLKDLMNDLNRSVDLPYGVRRVYSPTSGREINDIEDLADGSSYVCASFEPFKPAKYGDGFERPWNIGK